jgi:hypothetical protein
MLDFSKPGKPIDNALIEAFWIRADATMGAAARRHRAKRPILLHDCDAGTSKQWRRDRKTLAFVDPENGLSANRTEPTYKPGQIREQVKSGLRKCLHNERHD